MEYLVDMIAESNQGPISVAVNCFQLNQNPGNDPTRWVSARMGSRIVEAKADSVEGLTSRPVHFALCTKCKAASVGVGVAGDVMTHMTLLPEDPRAKLLASIISETENGGEWGRNMTAPARVVGMVNVHGAVTMTQAGMVCFNC